MAFLALVFAEPSLAPAEIVEVLLRNAHYRPEEIPVVPGDTVVFRNTDNYEHSIKLLLYPELLNRIKILGGGSYSFTIPESMASGRFLLGCDEHPAMYGNLIVSAP